MGKYVVVEMQNGVIGGNTWVYDDRPSAEVKLYQVLAEVVKSPVETHTVMLMTDEGFVIDCKCYKHAEQASDKIDVTADSGDEVAQ